MFEAAAATFVGEATGDAYRVTKSIIGRKFNHANDLNSNYRRLIEEAERLFSRRDDVKAEANKDKTKSIGKEFTVWIGRVMSAEKEVQELKNEYIKGSKRPFGMRDSWSRSHSDLGEHLAKKCKELCGLLAEGRVKIEPIVERLLERVRTFHVPKVENKPSLHWAAEEILGPLRDQNVKRVGLWGTVGIGKTTIMHNLNDNEEIVKIFDIVMFASASKDNSIEKLQNVLAWRPKQNVEGISDPQEMSWRISEELENKRYLLRLDEAWDAHDLQAVGILDNQKNNAWKMFWEKAGQNITLPGVEKIARRVAEECAGLPLLIDRVARHFRRKDNVNLWRDGLRILRRWPTVRVQGMDEVLDFLKFCYEELDDEGQKMCFLYGASYPQDCDIHVDYLLECWIAEGFMKDAVAFTKACDKGHTILHDLINVSLLERSEKKQHVKMNKFLWNLALIISSGTKFLVKAREALEEPPNREEWNMANHISLMDNNLCTLPETVDCKDLLALMLQRNYELSLIPDSFFESMKKLLVLDLHGTRIVSLPPSILSLTSLKALYLNSCSELMELPNDMRALINLEVLDIRGTGINHLPCQIGHLTNLKCLRISLSNSCPTRMIEGHSRVREGSDNVISRLSLLEELSIDVDPHNQWWDRVVKVITKEVASLARLKSLSFCFPSVDHSKIFVTSSSLWKNLHFRFSVGCHESNTYRILDHFKYEMCRCLKYINGIGVDRAVSDLPAENDALELVSHKGISCLSDFGIESINKMQGCLIEECSDIQAINDGSHTTEGALGCLEKMVINNAQNLICIWKCPVHPGSLNQLTTLSICKCPLLRTIFSHGMIQQLSQLHHLRVEECHEIVEIILESENGELEPNAFPCLKTLILIDLPKLKSIWTDDSLEWPSLESITICTCQSLMRLPFGKDNVKKLRYIEAQLTWWRELEWQDDTAEQKLRSICKFL